MPEFLQTKPNLYASILNVVISIAFVCATEREETETERVRDVSDTKKIQAQKSDLPVLRVNMDLLSLRPIFVFPHHVDLSAVATNLTKRIIP